MRQVTAVIPTRGDVDIYGITELLKLHMDVIVWNNAETVMDLRVLGAYAACQHVTTDLVYRQDDDVLVSDPMAIVDAWEPGKIVCNMPAEFRRGYQHRNDALLGFGSCFERSLIRPAFERYLDKYPIDSLLLDECDRIFTGLNHARLKFVDVEKVNMPYASDANRMWKRPDHRASTINALSRVAQVLYLEAEDEVACTK